MSIFNSVLSLTGKRFNSDSQPSQDQHFKKQRVHDEVISRNPLITTANHEGRANGDNLAAIKNQANKLIMAFIQNQSKIETANDAPHAYLTKNIYSTLLVDKIMDSSAFDYDERQVWSLAALLFGQEEVSGSSNDLPIPSPTATTVTAKQRRRLRNWIRSTVLEEIQQRRLLDVDMDKIEDDWKRAFYYMSSGQVVQACELVQQLGDDALATMMVVHFQQEDDVCDPSEKQVLYWQQRDLFDVMPLYRRKMWYVLQGQLGYVDHIKTVVTQDLPWPQVLLLYTLYSGRRGDLCSGLAAYHTLTSPESSGVIGVHQLRARKHTAQVPSNCLWYVLLQWWSSSRSSSVNNSMYRKELEMELPLQCRWVLLLHVSHLFENGDDALESWKQQWCDELYNTELEYMAIHAGLYLSRPEIKIKELLSRRLWDKEHYLSRQLQIPSEWITDSKALYALNHQLYDKEVDYYLESNENAKARDAILNHMIPALFLDGKRVDTITTYLARLTTLFPDDMDLQHTISILHNIHIILIDYPRIITQLSSTPAQLTTMVNELTLAVQNLTSLKESKNLQDPLFCSKVARQLISTAASFMDDEKLNTLIETCPVEIYSNQDTLELLSRAMSNSIAKKIPY